MSFTVAGLLLDTSAGIVLGVGLGVITILVLYYYKAQYCKREAESVKDGATKYLELRDNFKNYIRNNLDEFGLSYEECIREFKKIKNASPTGLFGRFLIQTVNGIVEGDFSRASENMKHAKKFYNEITTGGLLESLGEDIAMPRWYYKKIGNYYPGETLSWILNFATRACDALYLGDVEKMRELLNEAREMLDERDKFVIGDVKFFKYLFEFHYFLLKAVVEAYEAEQREVQRLMAAEKEKFKVAEETGVEVPAGVQKVSAEEPEQELYRGEVRFTMGALSQERVGMLVITNKRVKLHGKYRLRGTVATVALKAALRAAGVGEVNEEFSLKEIEWIELKKALLGGYYLELKAKGKKYTIYTDAAQHIYNLLRQYR